MTLISADIELFIRGKCSGEMSGGKCPDTIMKESIADCDSLTEGG